MNRITAILTLFAALSVVVTACTPLSSAGAASTTPEATTVPTLRPSGGGTEPSVPVNPPVDSPSPQPKTITLDDQGKTIQMTVGQSFLLKLGEEYAWEVTLGDQNVVSRAVNITVVRGAQGIYRAHQAGTTTLTATGDPQCRQSQPPCMVPSRVFTVTIVVQ